MSFREKMAWVSLATMLGLYGIYFWSLYHSGAGIRGYHFGDLLETVVALAIVQGALTFVVTISSLKEARAPRDERERLIDLKATRFAYGALAGSVACACFFGAFNPPIIFNPNALLFILVVAEMLRLSCQIVQYRRGS